MELTDHRKPVRCLAFGPDGSLRLASGSDDGTIKVINSLFKNSLLYTYATLLHTSAFTAILLAILYAFFPPIYTTISLHPHCITVRQYYC